MTATPDTNNEVARLGEENAKLKGIIRAIIENRRLHAKSFSENADDFEEMLNGLAPAPEEAVPDRIKSLAEDFLKLHKPDTEPAAEWRIRAEGERIEPLEKEICMLEKGMDMGSRIPSRLVGWTEITTCLRYLRDEIEALKKNQK